MDSFEHVIAAILQRQGFWTVGSFKVELTKDEKVAIGRHSSPRWELDIVAYRPMDNDLRIVECKSYLDSPGVDCGAFDGSRPQGRKSYKLFFDDVLRRVVLARLTAQLIEKGFCRPNPKVTLCLAAGKIRGDETRLREHFEKNGWLLITPSEIRTQLRELRDVGYENTVAAVVAKLLLREAR